MCTGEQQQQEMTANVCHDERFQPDCSSSPGHVVLVRRAQLGRMHLGKCVKQSLGYLGCAVEVTRLLDTWCTGLAQCDVSVIDPLLRQLKPCPDDVTWYLEVKYSCVPGM